MNWPADAQNWMDVIDHALVLLGAIVLAAIPGWLGSLRNHRGIREIRAQNEKVMAQVINGHSDAPPLRADVDRLGSDLERIAGTVDRLASVVETVSRDQISDREALRGYVAELRADIGHVRAHMELR